MKIKKRTIFITLGVILFAILIYFGYIYLLNNTQIFSPTAAGLSIGSALFLSLILGLVHGATPDEHTWPITFSYAVGSMTTKNGAKAGLLFSAGFTFQRALMSELAFLVLAPFLRVNSINGVIYMIVGSVMAVSGFYILKRGLYPHLHTISHALHKLIDPKEKKYKENEVHKHSNLDQNALENTRPIPLKLTVIHGLIAGFGFGAFAIILYTVIAPLMPNAYVAWIPGALFGVGTMIMQVIFGAAIGKWMRMRKYTEKEITFIGRETSGNMLAYGGLAFVFGGLFLLSFPTIANFSIGTGIGIPNLDSINIGLILVMITVIIVSIPSYFYALKKVNNLRKTSKK
ncbi:MAG: hypothetical protein QXD23_01740 [Candidatus Micrarchaeaceae archaeon]